ncbi:MAG: DNA-3-methyladenine glycosylase I [Arenicellales bacterium]
MAKKISRFKKIFEQAADRKGGQRALKKLLPDSIKTPTQLSAVPDDRYLAEITKSIFKAGFVWKVIDNKWPAFEQAFWNFDIQTCLHMSPEDEDRLCTDERIVRNRQKILTVPRNAGMIAEINRQHGSFGRFLGAWPSEDYVGLLDYFKKHGERMGGNSCQYFLRFVGKDGFLLTPDVIRALINAGVIDKPPTAKAAKRAVQDAFNQWQHESRFNLAQMSRILAISIG